MVMNQQGKFNTNVVFDLHFPSVRFYYEQTVIREGRKMRYTLFLSLLFFLIFVGCCLKPNAPCIPII